MATATFDTLHAVRTLESAGLERPTAEAIAEVIQQRGTDYVTQADLAATKADLTATIAELKSTLLLAMLGAVGVNLAGVGILLAFFAPGS